MNGAAADRVEHQRRDLRVLLDDRIILRQLADVRIEGPVVVRPQLPVRAGQRKLLGFMPTTLLEAHNPETGLGESPGSGCPGCTGSDYENVDDVAIAHGEVLCSDVDSAS